MSENSNHITRIVTALVTAVRCACHTRSMRCVDKQLARLIDQFESLEQSLDAESFPVVCKIAARYLVKDDLVPSTMAKMADAMRPVLLLAHRGKPHHAGVDYECMFVAFCSDDTAQLAKRMSKLATELSERCEQIAEMRGGGGNAVNGRIMFVHANESNYDKRPPVAKAASMSGKSPLAGISIEFFYAAELQFDRFAHVEVSDHVPLDLLVDGAKTQPALAAELHRDRRRGWEIALSQRSKLPILQCDDILVRLIGVRPGQVIRVELRDPALGGTTFEYRQTV